MIECPACHGAVTGEEFVGACDRFRPDVRVVDFTCPRCGEATQAQLEPGRVYLGYIYAAGSPHFSGEQLQQLPELEATWREGTDLMVRLDEREFRVPAIGG